MNENFIPLIVFLGVFIQSLSGFGFGLVVMPLLLGIIELKIASPLVALMGLIVVLTLTFYHKSELKFRLVLPLIIASSLAIPFGILAVKNIDNKIGLAILGVIVISYSLYSLFNFSLPKINSVNLSYACGFLSGLLSGAYNTGGPPMVIYANCCRWNPTKFKSNISAFFLINVIFLNINHVLQGNINREVLKLFMNSLPSIFIGLCTGLFLAKFINTFWFDKIVLILLLCTGIKLLFFP
jgi:uncharacterized membrane protein YfcA